MDIELTKQITQVNITVLGIGGGGISACSRLVTNHDTSVRVVCVDTNRGMVTACGVDDAIHIGPGITKGLGTGGVPEKGKLAALECLPEISQKLIGTEVAIITAGLGGGTGSGAAPVIAGLAKESGCLTLVVATTPFSFEGKVRSRQADEAIEKLITAADSLVIISNKKLMDSCPKGMQFDQMLKMSDAVLAQYVQAIIDMAARLA